MPRNFDDDFDPFDDPEAGMDGFLDGLDRESILDDDEDVIGGLDEEDIALLGVPRKAEPAAKKPGRKPRK